MTDGAEQAAPAAPAPQNVLLLGIPYDDQSHIEDVVDEAGERYAVVTNVEVVHPDDVHRVDVAHLRGRGRE